METTELLKKVRKIELKTKGLSNQIFSGHYHSSFKGRGMAFSEVREYQHGDDIRNIDWNVTARYDQAFVKVFEEERELTVMLLVDVSGSGNFGTRGQLKREVMTEICAVLSFSAIQNNDKVGVIFFSDQVEKYIPPKKGKSHILRIIRELIEFKPQHQGTNLDEALRYFNNVIKRRSIAFLLSDFLDDGFEDSIRIANRKHDLVALRIYDKAETELPNAGLMKLRHPETGKLVWRDTSSHQVRTQFAARNLEHEAKLRDIFNKGGIDIANIATDQGYVTPLMNLFKRRESRF